MTREQACHQFEAEHPLIILGHAHLVIDDLNVEDESIYWAIAAVAKDLATMRSRYDASPEQSLIVLKFLISLLDLAEGEGQDGEEDATA